MSTGDLKPSAVGPRAGAKDFDPLEDGGNDAIESGFTAASISGEGHQDFRNLRDTISAYAARTNFISD